MYSVDATAALIGELQSSFGALMIAHSIEEPGRSLYATACGGRETYFTGVLMDAYSRSERVRVELDRLDRLRAQARRRMVLRMEELMPARSWRMQSRTHFLAAFNPHLDPRGCKVVLQALGAWVAAVDRYGRGRATREEVADAREAYRVAAQTMAYPSEGRLMRHIPKLQGYYERCAQCDTLVVRGESVEDGGGYELLTDGVACQRCVDVGHVFWSALADGYVLRSDAVAVFNSVSAYRWSDPNDYYPAGWRVPGDYIFHDGVLVHFEAYDELRDDGYFDDDDDDGAQGPILGYHGNKHLAEYPVRGEDSGPLLGMELEVEVVDGDRDSRAQELLDKMGHATFNRRRVPYCGAEDDGSLSYGFEVVTVPATLDVHAAHLKENLYKEGLRSHDTSTCGLHVHIDKRGMSRLQIGRMVAFVNGRGNRPLIEAVARRYANGYCTVHPSKHVLSRCESRYEAVNLTNRNTVELRIFKGTLRYESIMACIEFSRVLYDFCREVSLQDLTTPAFLHFISRPENAKVTKHLRQVLYEKNMLTGMRAPMRELTAFADV